MLDEAELRQMEAERQAEIIEQGLQEAKQLRLAAASAASSSTPVAAGSGAEEAPQASGGGAGSSSSSSGASSARSTTAVAEAAPKTVALGGGGVWADSSAVAGEVSRGIGSGDAAAQGGPGRQGLQVMSGGKDAAAGAKQARIQNLVDTISSAQATGGTRSLR